MAFIPPSHDRPDPKQELRSSGTFLAKLEEIVPCRPDPQYPGSRERLAFRFRTSCRGNPACHNKTAVTVVTASIYSSKQTGKESNLVKLLRMMGVPNPEKGFDPDEMLDRWFHISCTLHNGKAFVASVVPAPVPAPDESPAVREFVPGPDATPKEDAGEIPF